jgi:hypothetical protein
MMRLFGHRSSRNSHPSRRRQPQSTVLRIECLEARLALSGLNVTFRVENPSYNETNTYVTFIDGSLGATYNGGHAVELNHSYTLQELNGPINIVNYTNGRIFVSYGAGVAGDKPPEAVNSSIPSYKVRHDKFEITYSETNTNSVANLTAVDFFSIPMELNTYASGSTAPTDALTYRIAATTLWTDLAALAGDSSNVLLTESGEFLRVLAPHTTTATRVQYYTSLQPYIDAVKTWQTTSGHSTTIEGLYSSAAGGSAATTTQNYSFQATVESDGSLKLVGGGDVIGQGHTLTVAASGLANGIYLGNVAWTGGGATGTFDDNDVYAAAVRDVLAGFNLGFIASETIDPNTGTAFGAESSRHWWSSTKAFNYLQPNHIYYNQYAQSITSNSDAYSWAFSDRWSHVQAHLYGMETLEVVLLPDSSSKSASIGVYEPSTSMFYLRDSNTTGYADITFGYGPAGGGWTPLVGDWRGSGTSTVGIYNPATSTFFLKNSNAAGYADVTFTYSATGSSLAPLVGDWDGDGTETIGLYDASTSTFSLRNSNTSGAADLTFAFGTAGAGLTPLVGDWNGDGTDTVGVYAASTATFALRNSNTAGSADHTFAYGPTASTWTPIAGDWKGISKDTIGLYDASTSTFYLRNSNTSGTANISFGYGEPGQGWKPLAGNWTGNSLLAAYGAVATLDSATLTNADLQPLAEEAVGRWAAAGLDAATLARLRRVEFIIGDLSGSQLGLAAGDSVYLDLNAAGHGWFIDLTPAADEEFTPSETTRQLTALDPRAVDQIDLLTVVEHELGHIAGLDDLDAAAPSVMASELHSGVRWNL